MSASVAYSTIVRMLDNCAAGYTIRRSTHGRVVEFKGKVFRDLPKYDDIEIGHVRKMVRNLGIDQACARKYGCY
jgi:hypothetical protein